MMEIFDIHEEVFYRHIWPLLEWRDVLQFRQVSKHAKQLISSYLWSQPERVPELEINETDNTLEQFLERGIPTTKIYLNNQVSGPKFFDTNATSLNTLLTTYGLALKELRIHTLSQFLIGKEREFFNLLPQFSSKLDTLLVRNWVGITDAHAEENSDQLIALNVVEWKDKVANHKMFPPVFQTLKRVEIGMEDNWESEGASVFVASLGLIKACAQAEVFAVPFNYKVGCSFPNVPAMKKFSDYPPETFSLKIFFCTLMHKMLTQHSKKGNGVSMLKSYNFKHSYYYHNSTEDDNEHVFQQVVAASKSFLELCEMCLEYGVMLEMVNCKWFGTIIIVFFTRQGNKNNRDLGGCVKSMMNVDPSVISHVNLINLEKLVLITSQSCLPVNWSVVPLEWPSLTALSLIIDSEMTSKGSGMKSMPYGAFKVIECPSVSSLDVFGLCFGLQMFCPRLSDLSIAFESSGGATVQVVVTSAITRNIIRTCANLRKLALTNWTGTNKSLSLLWEGLPNLEEITLEKCSSLGNNAFVGKHVENPVFLRLHRLRKLSLLGLDEMPKISNTLFNLVLCHMSLTHLKLTSQQPIKNVNADGIRSLIEGEFSRSVKKFSFKGWSLADCSEEEFGQLGAAFAKTSCSITN